MSIYASLTPAGLSSQQTLPNTDPDTGVVTFTSRPTRRAWATSQDLLTGLGVNVDVYGRGRAHSEDLELAEAWLVAHDVRLVIIRHADNIIRTPGALVPIKLVTDKVGADLVVTCEEPGDPRVADRVIEHGGSILEWTDLLALIQERTRPVPPVPSDEEPDFPQFLPRVDFYLFRARCRDTLTPAQHEVVDRLYRETFRRAKKANLTTDTAAREFLGHLIAQRRTPGEAETIARATQAAMFTQGYHLKVNVPTLLSEVAARQHRRFTPPEVRALRAYRNPGIATIGVLYDANLSNDAMMAITVGQVDQAGHVHGVDHLPMQDDARTYLRAQRHLRLSQGAGPDDPLIVGFGKFRSQTLRRIGVDLNLPTVAPIERRHTRKQDRWQHALGVTVNPLGLRKPKTRSKATKTTTKDAA